MSCRQCHIVPRHRNLSRTTYLRRLDPRSPKGVVEAGDRPANDPPLDHLLWGERTRRGRRRGRSVSSVSVGGNGP
jgi:hypothetical protein